MGDIPLMTGFPPPIDSQVTLANWRKPPFNRWAFHHVREIVPSVEIPNDPANVGVLPIAPRDFAGLRIPFDGTSYDLDAFLAATNTDAMVILHDGRIVHESYGVGMTSATPHILMSVSKSVLGLLVGVLVERGTLDVTRPVTDLIPEVKSTAYAGATVRDLLDMRVGVLFDEDYLATAGPIIEYRKAQGWDPLGSGEAPSDLRAFYALMTAPDGRHNDRFHYVSPNTDLMGWAIERATGIRYADLVSDLLWRPIGSEHSAYITVDRLGAPRCAGGFCATARDLARVGQMIAEGGRRDGRQVAPSAWINDILTNGDRAAWDRGDFTKYFPDMPIHYRGKWYVRRGDAPMMFAVGVFGQNLFIDPTNSVVISKFSSQALPMDEHLISLTARGIDYMSAFVRGL
ncbi:MAG: serine hydrolase domain-containing protein [Stellaceae bacterium]